MKFTEVGFRGFYHQFCAVPLKAELKGVLEGFPEAEIADYVLVYGYIDHTAGLTLEVLAAAVQEGEEFSFSETQTEVSSKIRIGSIAEDEVYYFDDEEGELGFRYDEKIMALSVYGENEEIMESREFEFMDDSRCPEYPDDILVYLLKEGNEPEGCWARVEGLDENRILGMLLQEPKQDFGVHEKDRIEIYGQKEEEDRFILCCDLNEKVKLTAEDLADGTLLEKAIRTFREDQTQQAYVEVLQILKDSVVVIPCTAVMSEKDRKKLEEKITENEGKALEEWKDNRFTLEEEMRLVPDILQGGEDYYFPVFSNEEAMGDYGKAFSKMTRPLLEAVTLAKNNEKKPVGIVVNAFTESFVLVKDLWDIIGNMQSLI